VARDILDSGRALAKMQAIIKAQGEPAREYVPGHLVHEVLAGSAGVVTGIDNFQLARIARLAGAPMDKGAGVDLFRRLGDTVHEGDSIYRIHAEFPADFQFALALAAQDSGFRIGEAGDVPHLFVEF
jgi:thymidine phosphorylase